MAVSWPKGLEDASVDSSSKTSDEGSEEDRSRKEQPGKGGRSSSPSAGRKCESPMHAVALAVLQ